MPYATKAQIERARQPDLLTFLRRYKPDELIPTGPGAYKLRSHDSLKLSNGKSLERTLISTICTTTSQSILCPFWTARSCAAT